MRNLVRFSAFTILVAIMLSVPASAHPGRTDANGGHTDHSTGEYHYHHGYPAHDHYDMDGDGDLDCPYNFDDKTGENSGGTGSGASSNNLHSTSGNSSSKDTSIKNDTDGTGIHPIAIIGVSAVVLYALYALIRAYVEDRIKERELRNKNAAILRNLGCEDIEVPKNVILLENGTPALGNISDSKPFGTYTVYITRKGTRFHASPNCSRGGNVCHIWNLPKGMLPCKNCASCLESISRVPEWYLMIKEKRAIRKTSVVNSEQKIQRLDVDSKEETLVHDLSSSMFAKAEYCRSVIYLTFTDGGIYAYYNVPRSVYDEFVKAQSPERYFQEKIHGVYPYTPYHE